MSREFLPHFVLCGSHLFLSLSLILLREVNYFIAVFFRRNCHIKLTFFLHHISLPFARVQASGNRVSYTTSFRRRSFLVLSRLGLHEANEVISRYCFTLTDADFINENKLSIMKDHALL